MSSRPICTITRFSGLIIAILLFSAIFASGCIGNDTTSHENGRRDDTKALWTESPHSGSRIIAGDSDAAELLLTIGSGKSIVGITDPCLEHNEIREKLSGVPSIGDSSTPDIEKMLLLKPDYYITYSSFKPKNIDKILALNISVIMLDCYKLENLSSDASTLGTISGNNNGTLQYLNFNNKYLNLVSSRLSNITPGDMISVYGESSDYTPMVRKSGGGQIINALHARNVYGNSSIPEWPVINSEWVLEKDPEVIIKNGNIEDNINSLKDTYESFLNRSGYHGLRAVKTNRVFIVNSDIISSPKAVLGLVYLAKVLYPERFSDTNPDEVKNEYVKLFRFGTNLTECVYPQDYLPK